MPATPLPRLRSSRLLTPFVLATAVVLGLSLAGFYLLSSVRAFVGAESLWAKGRGTAITELRRFAVSGAEDSYRRFEAALGGPLGDRRAREALDRSPPDTAEARRGFVAAGNHPADADAMIWLYRYFGATGLMRDAVAAWAEGDHLVGELQRLGAAIHGLRAAEPVDVTSLLTLTDELDRLEIQLVELGKRFSANLGSASRATLELLAGLIVLFALGTLAAVYLFAQRALGQASRQQGALLAANRRWQLATQSAGMGVFEWQVDADAVLLDAVACAICGIECATESRRVPRAELHARVHREDQPELRKRLEDARRDGLTYRHRYRIVLPDGRLRHIEATGHIEKVAEPLPALMLGILRDVTDAVALAQIDTEREAAARVERARNEFLSRLSHELRTPLNAVLGFAQLIESERAEPVSDRTLHRVGRIRSAGQHLLRLVDDVLDLTRIDAAAAELRCVPVESQRVLQRAIRLVRPQQESMGIEFVSSLPEQPVCVMADRDRLEHVLINLLGNACKYNRPAGSVFIQHARVGDDVTLRVQDQGEGLSEDEIALLFQPFRRMSRPGIEGTGLGLVIVKSLMLQMGGDVSVMSARGHGCSFTIRLPAAPDGAPAADTAAGPLQRS